MSKYVGRPRIFKTDSSWNVGGDYDYYAEIAFKIKQPVKFYAFGKNYTCTHIIVFDGDLVWRSPEYLTSSGDYISAPISTAVMKELYSLATKACEGRGKLRDEEGFVDRIKEQLVSRGVVKDLV